jgi:hypothetical protein
VNAKRRWSYRSCVLATLLVVGISISGCADKADVETVPGGRLAGRVTLEGASNVSSNTDWATRVFPARFSASILPRYPAEAVDARIEKAAVRVDFVIGKDGLGREVRASIVDTVPHAEIFVAACLAVADRWRFSPAWRLASVETPHHESGIVMDSKAYLVFHFDLTLHQSGEGVAVRFGDSGG